LIVIWRKIPCGSMMKRPLNCINSTNK
jgi:hypothetical protein